MPHQGLCEETFKVYQFGAAKHKHTSHINYTISKTVIIWSVIPVGFLW